MAQTLAKTRKRLTHEERHEHLLDVAAKLMLEHGFEALTMEAVKERAGVSRGLAYTHFVSAEELVFALYEREMTELERRLDAMAAASGSFDDRVRIATQTYFAFVADRGGLLATLQIKLPERWFKPSVRERLARLLAALVRRGRAGVRCLADTRAVARTRGARRQRDARRRPTRQTSHARRSGAAERRVRARRLAPAAGDQLMPFARRDTLPAVLRGLRRSGGCRRSCSCAGSRDRAATGGRCCRTSRAFASCSSTTAASARAMRRRPPYSSRQLADDVVAVMDAAGVARAHVFGISLGGMIVQQLALAHGDRDRSARDRLLDARRPPRTHRRACARARASAPAAPRQRRDTPHPERRDPTDDRARRACPRACSVSSPPRFATTSSIASARSRIRRSIVTGDDDAIIPPANSRLLAERIPNARLVVLPGARHDFTTDRPVESGRAVVEFLTR